MNAAIQQEFNRTVAKLKSEVQTFTKAFASRKKTEYTPDQLRSLAPEMSQVLQQDVSILERNVMMMNQVIRRLKSKGKKGSVKILERAVNVFQPYVSTYKANLRDWTTLAKQARANGIKKPRKVNAYLVRSPRKQANKTFIDLHYRALEIIKQEFPENRNVHGWHTANAPGKISTTPYVVVPTRPGNVSNMVQRRLEEMQSKIVSQLSQIKRLEISLNNSRSRQKLTEKALMDCLKNAM